MFIIQYILPGIIIIATIIMMIVLWKAYGKDSRMHLHRSKEFVVHTIGSMLVICIGGMSVLMLDGLWAVENIYKWLHESLLEPTKSALPIVVSILTTFLGLLLTFRLIHPRIAIYPLAAYEINDRNSWLTFHVQNLGWFECIDMKAELFECSFQNRGIEINKKMDPLALEPLAQATIIDWHLGDTNSNTYLIETKYKVINRRQFAQSDHFLELRVKLTHPISRITKVYVQDFTPTDIHVGEFKGRYIMYDNDGIDKPVCTEKVIAFMCARYLKMIEALCIIALFIVMVAYIVVNPLCEMPVRGFQHSFYIVIMITAIIELLRQFAKRPIQSKKTDTNI